jgi:hypothetical protein
MLSPTSLHLPLAFLNIPAFWIAILVPIAAMVFAGTMAGLGMYFQHQRQRLWHETARIALEKGQPVPAFNGDKKADRFRQNSSSDFRGGLILIGVGAGIYLFFATVGAPEARFIGAIPGFIGVALLVHGVLLSVFPNKNNSTEDQPTRS